MGNFSWDDSLQGELSLSQPSSNDLLKSNFVCLFISGCTGFAPRRGLSPVAQAEASCAVASFVAEHGLQKACSVDLWC